MPDGQSPNSSGVPFAKMGCLWEDHFMSQAVVTASFVGEARAFRAGGLLLLAL
jgi:hypothetical protein